MHTVENQRIRVTVSDETWQGYLESVAVRAARSDEPAESIARGKLLSDAMMHIGRTQGKRPDSLDSEITERRVMELARDNLINKYLSERGLIRPQPGMPISMSMSHYVELAEGWADSILYPLSGAEINHYVHELTGGDVADKRTQELIKARCGQHLPGYSRQFIDGARSEIEAAEAEKSPPRSSRFDIQVIGDLPEQIGTADMV